MSRVRWPSESPSTGSGRKTAWRPREPLFDYPLTLPHRTAYHELEIEPNASDEEVTWAKNARSVRLKGEKKGLQKKLEAVHAQVKGLREAYRTVQELHAQGADVDESQLKQAQGRLRALEQDAQRIDPEFRKNRERVAELKDQIEQLHSMALDKPEKRREYGRCNPPLALLRLADCARLDFLDDVRTTLFLLRREVSEFLARRAGDAFHPSDLTRDDFSHDFTANELLDGPTEG